MNKEIIDIWLWIYAILFFSLLIGLSVDFYFYNKRFKIFKDKQKTKDKKDKELFKWTRDFKPKE
jgi:hypothetical protein